MIDNHYALVLHLWKKSGRNTIYHVLKDGVKLMPYTFLILRLFIVICLA
jgi:hypothetical protein